MYNVIVARPLDANKRFKSVMIFPMFFLERRVFIVAVFRAFYFCHTAAAHSFCFFGQFLEHFQLNSNNI